MTCYLKECIHALNEIYFDIITTGGYIKINNNVCLESATSPWRCVRQTHFCSVIAFSYVLQTHHTYLKHKKKYYIIIGHMTYNVCTVHHLVQLCDNIKF